METLISSGPPPERIEDREFVREQILDGLIRAGALAKKT
jgi:hypothetical protein